MPPKKASGTAAKAEIAKKQKQVEDKTFGLKNKNKSKQVQKHVQQMQQGVSNLKKQTGIDDHKNAVKKKKDEEAAREKELNDIFRVAITQPKVPIGVDPKSVLCEFFRRGACTKGFKCKYSHDLNVERKGEKIDLYSDQRENEEDNMEEWDQAKLEEVVASKGAEYKNSNRPTDIVCKHFLDAVEKKQYGWFWACPNGNKECMYRHALPPGYVLKSQMKLLLEEESANRLSVEEEIEQQRVAVKSSTPLNAVTFADWKRQKQAAKEAELAAKMADRMKHDRLSGRELFTHDASLFVDDEDGFAAYQREEEEEEATETKHEGTNGAAGSGAGGPSGASGLTEEDERFLMEDEEEIDMDDLEEAELDDLEAKLEEQTRLKDEKGGAGTVDGS